MTTIDISEFYSPTGTGLIEKFYSYDYLSIGGLDSTEILTVDASITADTRVLDVGSGLGGPPYYWPKPMAAGSRAWILLKATCVRQANGPRRGPSVIW